MHLWQERAHTNIKITVDGLPPEKSPESITLLCSRYYGIALAMNRTRYAATLEKIEICVCMSCASLTRTKNSRIDMLKLAGRRPTLK